MKRAPILYAAALLGITALNISVLRQRPAGEMPAAAATPERAAAAAGPGLVEPLSEEVRVSAQISGRLDRVLVDEGDRVTAGQLLAVIDNGDYKARVASAQAELAEREASRQRVVNGARQQERQEAAASLAEAEAVLENARADRLRRENLLREHVVSKAEADDAERAARVAAARVEAARQRLDLIAAGSRDEDKARAAADVGLARARLDEARAVYEKTLVRAPIAGVVLRRHRKAGESVSTQFDSPIVTLADDRVRRVRVDVDEADVSRIALGQPAYVTADAFGDRRFRGKVVRIGRLLGRKHVRTDEPTERVDSKILETLVELEDGRELPFGLRVQAFIGVPSTALKIEGLRD
ncbi:MAG TPA: HlyD family efflux transporter periplasmic adaptor subunit [Vicinamibacterales bacterium]|nr:HlyD family efflux transporter periplasmic adaptor subunit [Vicinamibacterales bacterium]